MIDIKPFRSIRYTEKAGKYENLITQPYDKIDPTLQEGCYRRSEYNYCRLNLPIEEKRYEIAQQRIGKWTAEGVLSKDEASAIYVCRQEFEFSGRTYTRTGMIVALRLYGYEENKVFPHEVTYEGPKIDRVNMLRATQKNLESVFLMYSDPEGTTIDLFSKIAETQPSMQVEDSFRVKHVVWRVTDPRTIGLFQKAIENKTFVITDGHHRYESAIVYRDERREKEKWTEDSAFNFQMSYIVPIQDEGLIVLPVHRLLKRISLTHKRLVELGRFFTLIELEPDVEAFEGFLENNKIKHAFCIYDGEKAYGLLLKNKKTISELIPHSARSRLLDVVILRDVVFKTVLKLSDMKIDKDISYVRSIPDALGKVKSGEAKLAFMVNPIDPKTVFELAQKHQRMPEKSTDFYPKIVSGLTLMDLSPEEKL